MPMATMWDIVSTIEDFENCIVVKEKGSCVSCTIDKHMFYR